MSKKRNHRRTVSQEKIHDKAVKIRKMTDEQLVNYVEDRVAKAASEGYNRAKKENVEISHFLTQFLGEITCLPGIGTTTVEKMRSFAYLQGYIS